MMRLFLFIIIIVTWVSLAIAKKAPSGCFRAAVLDHVHQTDPNHIIDTAHNLELNLKVYEDAVVLAKQKDADIIVFPENGLIYYLLTRDQAENFAEDIPNLNHNLCSLDSKTVINRLSCLAKKHQIFIAANLLDRRPCDNTDHKCPADKKFLFNTAVIFDRNGTLIGKYHKIHLFGEMTLNVPPKPELVVVHTELGRLGLQICFDMIFEKPGHLLAQKNKIDTMIFPTWWFDEAPFLSSSQYQMAWAFGNNVSLLASNIHRIELGSRGSGIYIGPQKKFVSAIYDDSIERLVIANVPIKPKSNAECPLDEEIITVPQQIPIKKSVKYNYQNLNLMHTNLVELSDKNDSKTEVCHQGVCCSLEYHRFVMKNSICKIVDYIPLLSHIINRYFSLDERYYLLAGNRTRPGTYAWSEEFCALVQCQYDAKNGKTCSHFQTLQETNTLFSYAKLTGVFSFETTIYPSVVGSKHQLIKPENKWSYWQIDSQKSTKQFILKFGSKNAPKHSGSPLGTLALYGRVYVRDPPYERKPVKINL